TFEVTGTIQLTSALPSLSSNIDVQGPGADVLTVRRNTGGNYRIFTVGIGATVFLSGLTVTNGVGGIFNQGTLTLNNATVSGNSAEIGGSGGGIYNNGTLTLNNATVSSNYTHTDGFGGGGGGGIYNSGTLTLNNTTVRDNLADYDSN